MFLLRLAALETETALPPATALLSFLSLLGAALATLGRSYRGLVRSAIYSIFASYSTLMRVFPLLLIFFATKDSFDLGTEVDEIVSALLSKEFFAQTTQVPLLQILIIIRLVAKGSPNEQVVPLHGTYASSVSTMATMSVLVGTSRLG